MNQEQSLFFIFFVYGLAFFGMGLAMTMESGRGTILASRKVIRPLAGFGLIHGTHEWLESYLLLAVILGMPLPDWIPWLRLVLLVTSFGLLLVFALEALKPVASTLPRDFQLVNLALAGYLIVIIASTLFTYRAGQVPWANVVDALARYMLAVPAATLAALGLRARSLKTVSLSSRLATNLNVASISFGLYALTQLFVHPIATFPAEWINEETFLATLGFPIQLIRAVLAVFITIYLLRATYETDHLRRTELIAAQKARLEALEQQQQIRRELLKHTVRAQEDERARIAHELHDEMAQTLTALSLELASLRNSLSRRSASSRTVERILDLSRQVSQSLYRIMTDLRPAQLDELGVAQAIQTLVERDYQPKGFEFSIEVTGAPLRMDSIQETVLFRVAQEALTNIARHAEVKEGIVQLTFETNQVTLKISDRGRGFNPEENFRPPRGWGLEGMKERVESAGGVLHIESAPGKGTAIKVRLPVESKEQI